MTALHRIDGTTAVVDPSSIESMRRKDGYTEVLLPGGKTILVVEYPNEIKAKLTKDSK